MRALTLTQPWAGLVVSGIKRVENRPRPVIRRGDFGVPFALHASRVIDEAAYARIREIAPEMSSCERLTDEVPEWMRLSRITSAVIGVAAIDDVVSSSGYAEELEHELGDQYRWFFGPIGYVLRDVRALATPVPCRGWQGFWTLPPEIERAVSSQLGARA